MEFIAFKQRYICVVISCIVLYNLVCLLADSAYSGCCFGSYLVVTIFQKPNRLGLVGLKWRLKIALAAHPN